MDKKPLDKPTATSYLRSEVKRIFPRHHIVDIPMLTEAEKERLLKAINRVKKTAKESGKIQFVAIFFDEKNNCWFTESQQMVHTS